jgi:hypothetical protein
MALAVAPGRSAAAAAPAGASVAGATVRVGATAEHVVLARLGRGFRGGSRYRSDRARGPYGRSRSNRRAARPYRPRIGHFFGNVLRALGIAYLLHALFGWGAGGGSPFGLLVVLAFVTWLVTRRRRRARWDPGAT